MHSTQAGRVGELSGAVATWPHPSPSLPPSLPPSLLQRGRRGRGERERGGEGGRRGTAPTGANIGSVCLTEGGGFVKTRRAGERQSAGTLALSRRPPPAQ